MRDEAPGKFVRALESELTAVAEGKGPHASVTAPMMMTDEEILGGPNANKSAKAMSTTARLDASNSS